MKYKRELCAEAYLLITEEGLNNLDLAAALDISIATFYAWTERSNPHFKSEFMEAIELARRHSKEIRKQEILEELRRAAQETECTETYIEYRDGKEVKKIVKTKTRPPNIKAGLVYLEKTKGLLDFT